MKIATPTYEEEFDRWKRLDAALRKVADELGFTVMRFTVDDNRERIETTIDVRFEKTPMKAPHWDKDL